MSNVALQGKGNMSCNQHIFSLWACHAGSQLISEITIYYLKQRNVTAERGRLWHLASAPSLSPKACNMKG